MKSTGPKYSGISRATAALPSPADAGGYPHTHTGDTAANHLLSERRAAAVVRFLTETYRIDPGRLEVRGLGPSAPIASNDTPEGRQQNRRVELVRL